MRAATHLQPRTRSLGSVNQEHRLTFPVRQDSNLSEPRRGSGAAQAADQQRFLVTAS
jgi:hypothetical protein